MAARYVSVFSLRGLAKYWELSPLLICLGGACTMGMTFSVYSLIHKSDVAVSRRQETPPWERVNIETPQKLWTMNIKYGKESPEVQKLREEIGSYKY